jgi:hypothetical protein
VIQLIWPTRGFAYLDSGHDAEVGCGWLGSGRAKHGGGYVTKNNLVRGADGREREGKSEDTHARILPLGRTCESDKTRE